MAFFLESWVVMGYNGAVRRESMGNEGEGDECSQRKNEDVYNKRPFKMALSRRKPCYLFTTPFKQIETILRIGKSDVTKTKAPIPC